MKKAIIVGASSGIGKELALFLAKKGYEVGLMARRMDNLQALQAEIPTKTYVKFLDMSLPSEAMLHLQSLINEMGTVDLIVLNSGTGFLNSELDWEKELQTINVNVFGFCALAGLSYNYFAKQNHGHLVGISSIGAIRGNHLAPAYNASKAFMSNYLEGLRKKAFKDKSDITVLDVKPGFVATGMAKGEGQFWIAPVSKAVEQIFSAINSKKTHVYITKRWKLVGGLLNIMPNWLYDRIR